jgi:hypothetical protein
MHLQAVSQGGMETQMNYTMVQQQMAVTAEAQALPAGRLCASLQWKVRHS